MLTGKPLGVALREAMRRKSKTQGAIAAEFGVTQPSVSEWVRYGRIGKQHIPHLVAYFLDAVGPEHWGLPATWSGEEVTPWPFERLTPNEWVQLNEREKGAGEEAFLQAVKAIRDARATVSTQRTAKSAAAQKFIDKVSSGPAPMPSTAEPADHPFFKPRTPIPAEEPPAPWQGRAPATTPRVGAAKKRAKKEPRSQ